MELNKIIQDIGEVQIVQYREICYLLCGCFVFSFCSFKETKSPYPLPPGMHKLQVMNIFVKYKNLKLSVILRDEKQVITVIISE